MSLPAAMDGLIEYYKQVAGEHPDWDDYRAGDGAGEAGVVADHSGTRRAQREWITSPAICRSRPRSTEAAQDHDVEPRTLLVQYLREACGLTGTKIGCDTSSCGACTVLVDGESVKSCTMLAAQADGAHDHDDRGARQRRRVASGAASVPREPRPAVRLLHRRHGDGRGVAARRDPESDRARRAPRARGQPLPLHRLPQHREVGPRRRRADAGAGAE